MKLRAPLTQYFFASMMIMLASFSAFACDYHNQGGFGMYGQMQGLGPNHPLMQRHTFQQNQAQSSTPAMTISHTKTLTTKVSEKRSVDITYSIPEGYTHASLRFTHSDGLELDVNEDIKIDKANGVFTLNYVAKSQGRHHILVWADALKQTLPLSKVQRIEVTVD